MTARPISQPVTTIPMRRPQATKSPHGIVVTAMERSTANALGWLPAESLARLAHQITPAAIRRYRTRSGYPTPAASPCVARHTCTPAKPSGCSCTVLKERLGRDLESRVGTQTQIGISVKCTENPCLARR
jgi:hypothetical protein